MNKIPAIINAFFLPKFEDTTPEVAPPIIQPIKADDTVIPCMKELNPNGSIKKD